MKNLCLKYGFALGVASLIVGSLVVWKLDANIINKEEAKEQAQKAVNVVKNVANSAKEATVNATHVCSGGLSKVHYLFSNSLDKIEDYTQAIKNHVSRFFSKNGSYSYKQLMSEFEDELNRMNDEFLIPLNKEIKALEKTEAKKAALEDMQKIVIQLHKTMKTLLGILKQGGNKMTLGARLKLKQAELSQNMKNISYNVDKLVNKLRTQNDHALVNIADRLECLKSELELSFSATNMTATEILDILGYRLSNQ